MKPANFPAKKDARRVSAIRRMEASKKSQSPATQEAINNTLAKLVADPRVIRTKKVRGKQLDGRK